MDNSKCKYEVTILILTFNPDWEKLRKTLLSALGQTGIKKQVIISDDGSSDNLFPVVQAYLDGHQFLDYKLVSSKVNQGTCINYITGLLAADGEYTKAISPGDFLYSSDTLCKWYRFMKEHDVTASFGEAVFFHNGPGENQITPIPNEGYPFFSGLYSMRFRGRFRYLKKIDYLVMHDYAIGPSFFAATKIQIDYCRRLIGKIVYSEDLLYCLWLWDDNDLLYYPDTVVLYEFGSGISAGKNEVWNKRLNCDLNSMYDIIIDSPKVDRFTKQLRRMAKKNSDWRSNRITKACYFPAGIMFFLLRRITGKNNRNKITVDTVFLNEIGIIDINHYS